jgi:hypothetical protein
MAARAVNRPESSGDRVSSQTNSFWRSLTNTRTDAITSAIWYSKDSRKEKKYETGQQKNLDTFQKSFDAFTNFLGACQSSLTCHGTIPRNVHCGWQHDHTARLAHCDSTPRRQGLNRRGEVFTPGAPPTPLASAELYDPSSGMFRPTGNMTAPRVLHAATLLADGRVLITGGVGPASPAPVIANAELYDPSTGAFTPTGAFAGGGICDFCSTAAVLTNGKTLFSWQQPAQLYDPVVGTFSRTGAMIEPDHTTTTLLMDGTVLLTGGESDFGRSASAELYDPATGG